MLKKLQNWTLPPVLGKSPPDSCVDLGWESFPCVRGNVRDRPRHIPFHHCAPIIDHEVASSLVVHVEGRTVVTAGGTTYILDGEPRPSFIQHCKAMGINPCAPKAVEELFNALRA